MGMTSGQVRSHVLHGCRGGDRPSGVIGQTSRDDRPVLQLDDGVDRPRLRHAVLVEVGGVERAEDRVGERVILHQPIVAQSQSMSRQRGQSWQVAFAVGWGWPSGPPSLDEQPTAADGTWSHADVAVLLQPRKKGPDHPALGIRRNACSRRSHQDEVAVYFARAVEGSGAGLGEVDTRS